MYVPSSALSCSKVHSTLNLRESIGVALELGPPATKILEPWDRLSEGDGEGDGEGEGEGDGEGGGRGRRRSEAAWHELSIVREARRALQHDGSGSGVELSDSSSSIGQVTMNMGVGAITVADIRNAGGGGGGVGGSGGRVQPPSSVREL